MSEHNCEYPGCTDPARVAVEFESYGTNVYCNHHAEGAQIGQKVKEVGTIDNE